MTAKDQKKLKLEYSRQTAKILTHVLTTLLAVVLWRLKAEKAETNYLTTLLAVIYSFVKLNREESQ